MAHTTMPRTTTDSRPMTVEGNKVTLNLTKNLSKIFYQVKDKRVNYRLGRTDRGIPYVEIYVSKPDICGNRVAPRRILLGSNIPVGSVMREVSEAVTEYTVWLGDEKHRMFKPSAAPSIPGLGDQPPVAKSLADLGDLFRRAEAKASGKPQPAYPDEADQDQDDSAETFDVDDPEFDKDVEGEPEKKVKRAGGPGRLKTATVVWLTLAINNRGDRTGDRSFEYYDSDNGDEAIAAEEGSVSASTVSRFRQTHFGFLPTEEELAAKAKGVTPLPLSMKPSILDMISDLRDRMEKMEKLFE